jgi:hypothetical protein
VAVGKYLVGGRGGAGGGGGCVGRADERKKISVQRRNEREEIKNREK